MVQETSFGNQRYCNSVGSSEIAGLSVGVLLFESERISRRDFFSFASRRANTCLNGAAAAQAVDYENFLKLLSDERYNVCPIVEYDASYRPDKVNVLLRHDMDYDNGYGMLELDYSHGFRSTSYLRLHADAYYTIEQVAKFYQLLEKYGFEVGYHYEVIDLTKKGSVIDWNAAEKLFQEELSFLRQFFNVRSVCPHGGFANLPSRNFEFEQDESRLAKFGVFSAYKIPFSREVNFHYLSDTHDDFASTGLDYFRVGFGEARAGDVVEVLVHPQPGRWNYRSYRNDLPPALTPKIFQLPTTSVTLTTSSTSSASVTTSILTSRSTSSATSLTSQASQVSTLRDSVLDSAWQYLAAPITLCTVGALAFYKIHQRKLERQRSRKFCTSCKRELLPNTTFCDGCGKPIE